MIVAASLFVLGPLVLCMCVLELVAALLMFGGRGKFRRLIRLGWIGVWTLAILGAFFALLSGHYQQDWVHNFWAAQVPMVGLFVSSGMLLCRIWRDDACFIVTGGPGVLASRSSGRASRIHPAFLFLMMLVVLSLIPLALQLISPASYANPYSTGHPVRNLVELAQWGLGGPLPAYLAELGSDGVVRAHQNVPREVTVPMGTTLIAAWLWILFCVIALIGRIIPWARVRVGAYLVAPLAIGLMWFSGLGGLPYGEKLGLDPRYFMPNAARDSGIWRDEGVTLASYGGVMLLAAICTAVLALALGVERFVLRRRTATIAVASQSNASGTRPSAEDPTRLSTSHGIARLNGG
jgi:hypothetical protein